MEEKKYPLYFRKEGRCIKRSSDTTSTEVIIPFDDTSPLPLCMSHVTYPSRERLDEVVANMAEVDQSCFEDYIYGFIGRAEVLIGRPMTALQLERYQKHVLNLEKNAKKVL